MVCHTYIHVYQIHCISSLASTCPCSPGQLEMSISPFSLFLLMYLLINLYIQPTCAISSVLYTWRRLLSKEDLQLQEGLNRKQRSIAKKQWHRSGWQAAVYWWRRTLSPNCSGTREIPLRTNKIEERPETLLLLALIRTWEFRKCQDCGIRPSISHGLMMQRLQKPLRFVHFLSLNTVIQVKDIDRSE